MKYILDVSCLDELSSGAKQRFLNLYSALINTNKKKKFVIIYTTFYDVKKILNYPNVSFVKNNFNQDTYLKKMISIIFIFFFSESDGFFSYEPSKRLDLFTSLIV